MIKYCYIHIPFCINICSYCDFCKLFYKEELVNKYLETLEKEIKSTYHGEVLDTIYIGGGTPSCLSIKQLEKLFNIISIFNTSSDLEFTIEGNIETISKDKLLLYKNNGINRLSFGIESINKNNLDYLEREFSKEKTEKVINTCRKLGFNNINLDLIYALPTENKDILIKDIDYILSLEPEHISTYSLIIEDHTKLKINNELNIDEDLDEEMYEIIKNKLSNYNHYEISNFCKDGYYSRHNMCYWKNYEYYGFGLGASGYIGNRRITNTRSFNDYIKGNYIKEIEELNKLGKIEYEIILNLRIKEGIDLLSFKDRYNSEFSDLFNYKELVKMNYLIEQNNHLFIPEDKWYISNEIIVKLLGCEVYE